MIDVRIRAYQPADGSTEPSARAQAEGLAEVLDALVALNESVGFREANSSIIYRCDVEPACGLRSTSSRRPTVKEVT